MGQRIIAEFRKEIDAIKEPEFRKHVELIMGEADDFVIDLASSTSGKYHPLDETKPASNPIHFRRVFVLAQELSKIYKYAEREQDIMIACALLHDLFKAGIVKPEGKAHTVATHMIIIYDYIKSYVTEHVADISQPVKIMLRDTAIICLFHYGQWTPNEALAIEDNGIKKMSPLVGEMCQVFNVADCLAARRSVADIFQYAK